VGLERGPLSLVSTTEELLGRKSSVSGLEHEVNQVTEAKLATTFRARGCHVVSVTDPYGRILGFLERSRYYFFKATPPLHLRR
jgi:hypothetical protein